MKFSPPSEYVIINISFYSVFFLFLSILWEINLKIHRNWCRQQIFA